MTITSQLSGSRPTFSPDRDRNSRCGAAQMDDPDGYRSRASTEDGVSLASTSVEAINPEDFYYTQLKGELDADAWNLEAESWSLAVDQSFLKALNKDAIKRQDIIYELIQTEMHHVRTLKILYYVYMHELKPLGMDNIFPGVEALLSLHQHFLKCLKDRQIESREEADSNNYFIKHLGDILINQFSGAWGEHMMVSYSMFCGQHNQVISYYKEQMHNNKKLQNLIRKIGQLALVRRLGIPECFLLVTQRITKYPVLVERLIQNTDAETEEHGSLVKGLELIKETISQVNAQVNDYEKAARLREIASHLDPKAPSQLKDAWFFRKEDLSHGSRKLLHEGPVTWKFSSRQKDILAVLLSDMLLLLQEKDQKLVFASLENKLPVISLQGLIVREVAHVPNAMYLICACSNSGAEMYEIHANSKEECEMWSRLIGKTADNLRAQKQNTELISKLQHFQDILKAKDEQIIVSLTEKLETLASLYEHVMMQECPQKTLLLRGDASDLQLGETLLNEAIVNVEKLQSLLSTEDLSTVKGGPHWDAESIKVHGSPRMKNGARSDVHHPEGSEQFADEIDSPKTSASCHKHRSAAYGISMNLAQNLYSLHAVVCQQDSSMELQQVYQSKSSQPARHFSNILQEQERQRNLEKQREELADLNKQQSEHREQRQRWEKEQERRGVQIDAQEAQLKQKEEECRRREERLNEEQTQLERQKESYQKDLERLRESTKAVERDKEKLSYERERFEKQKQKFLTNLGCSNYDDPTQFWGLMSSPSFRGSVLNGDGTLITPQKLQASPSNRSSPTDTPPKVPPRRESMKPLPPKADLPMHLVSTTNQVQKPAVVLQKIPAKLAMMGKGKEKSFRGKKSHHRAHSAASIDVSEVLPIHGVEGGSLKAKMHSGNKRVLSEDTFNPLGSAHNLKPSQSFSSNKWDSDDLPPPIPPPFPKELWVKEKNKVVFF